MLGDEDDDVKRLLAAWRNERLSPALLPPAKTALANVLELLANQAALLASRDGALASLPGGAPPPAEVRAYAAGLAGAELERVRFVAASYVRTRLAKAEAAVLALLVHAGPCESSKSVARALGPDATAEELAHAERYAAALSRSLLSASARSSVGLARRAEGVHEADVPARPARVVVARALRDLGEIELDPATMAAAPVSQGDVFVLRADVAHPYVSSGAMELL